MMLLQHRARWCCPALWHVASGLAQTPRLASSLPAPDTAPQGTLINAGCRREQQPYKDAPAPPADIGSTRSRQWPAHGAELRSQAIWQCAVPTASQPASATRRISTACRAGSSWCRRLHLPGGPSPVDAGLFGVDGLYRPEDFQHLVQDAVSRCRALIQDAPGSAPPSPAIVDNVDEISDIVCQILDPAELCRNVAATSEWRRAATQACIDMESFVQELNMNQALYGSLNAALKASRRPHAGQFWESAEQRKVAEALHHDFVLGGVHLPEHARKTVASTKHQIHLTGMEFQAAISDPNQLVNVDLGAMQAGRAVPLDLSSLSALLQQCPDEELRRQLFLAGNRSPSSNLQRLDDLLGLRRKLAELTGFGSYAEYAIAPHSMAQSPKAVSSFLTSLSEALRPLAREELRGLARLKSQLSSGSTAPSRSTVYHWDKLFLMAVAKAKANEGESACFPLHACLKGIEAVVCDTMGLRLVEQPMGPRESWAPGVRKVALMQQDSDDVIGIMYLDMLRRSGKFPHAAQFNIRCGRRLAPRGAARHRYQLPVVALVCNFDARGKGLLPQEVETLFHEFGHALNSLLSTTRYQHLAGLRGALDYVEVPSHLWQSFAMDPRVLRIIASHSAQEKDNPPLPDAAIADLRRSSSMFAFLDLQQQVIYSMMDQRLHGPSVLELGTEQRRQVLSDLYAEHSDMPLVTAAPEDAVYPQVRFSHLVGYGASYYSYVLARSASASIFSKHFTGSQLPWRASGELIRRELLEPGGTVAMENFARMGVIGRVAGAASDRPPAALRRSHNSPILLDFDPLLEQILVSKAGAVNGGE
mmetsp:Transcript_16604/g.46356  ORF Transcript_16604/g.46356 Transcript_16604/m.46356 type:complete len:817 (+) Transcript_16604:937-3387(+)|eukprot:CAMPEP_0117681828 /NCGR_PEP_ID=MMETSP0804-20121206/19229_1 /TAXON_ID=1074897 /ORGANISM="Tetraselmis astigmatica, Strain CCMP880" /LENGTH=816 /DNA_ID=CAMNT_0005491689 /DNA_START=832 /DNA_END=3282 /DNA_ORIENTATION=-